ncbi:FHA domain-containing protein [Janibacter alittae]|uniref:FHA domain-containing protein n=1 Tax=Janibacter alittae TaxID=3115209 RepID=A0ABZ2MH70_9MICO
MEFRAEGRDGWVEFTRAGVHVLAKGDESLGERLAAALAAAGGDSPADVLTDVLTADGVRQTPDFAIVDETGLRVLVRGTARVLLTGADETTRELVAPARAPWIDEDIDEDTATAVLCTGEPEPVPAGPARTPEPKAPAAVSPQTAPEGVPGSPAARHPQFVDGHLVSARVPPRGSTAAAVRESSEEAVADDVRAPAPTAGVGPSTGVLPVAGDVPREGEPDRPRPSARLVLPTGEVVELDRGVLLGRAPRASAGIGYVGEPHLVRVASPDNEISRSHVEVYPEGTQVIARDLGSTNGTTLATPEGPSRRMSPGEPQPIGPGTTIRLAGQVAVVLEVG